MEEETNIYGGGILTASGDVRNSVLTRYQINTEDRVYGSNIKGELMIPEAFGKVLKKSINGLEEIKIDSYEKNKLYDPATFIPNYGYIVNLVLIFSWDANIMGNSETLKEVVNNTFHLIYPNIDNFKFNILRVTTKERDYDKEFFEFFTKG